MLVLSEGSYSGQPPSEEYLRNPSWTYLFSTGYTYFHESLDFLGYSEEFAGAKPVSADSKALTLSAVLKENMRVHYGFERNEGEVSRTTAPSLTKSAATKHAIDLEFDVMQFKDWRAEVKLGFDYASQGPTAIDCYSRGEVTLGGACDEADFRLFDSEEYERTGNVISLPVLRFESRQKSLNLGIALEKDTSFGLIWQEIGISRSELNFSSQSPLFDISDTFLLDGKFNGQSLQTLITQIENDLPQEEPWIETSLLYGVGVLKDFSVNYFVSVNAQAILIKRSDYIERVGGKEITNNFAINFSVGRYLGESASIHLSAEGFLNYLAGFEPIAYNRRTSRYFDVPYGQVTVGFVYSL